MREIKFRGINNDGNWCFGDLIQSNNDHNVWIHAPKINHTYKVDPVTVGQFTGLCDCEGKEIYEGDVVRHENYICLVVYNSTRFASFALRKDGWAFDHYFGEAFEASECHVVGNIYDSPELLEERR